MTAEEVAQFLKHHPQFFDQFPDLLESIYVPHPYGGRAIPLSERLILGLREKTKLLEGKLSELIQFGEENDAIGEKVHRLSLALLVIGFAETLIFSVLAAIGKPPSFFGVFATIQGTGSIAGGLTAAPLIRRIGETRVVVPS